jgi:hypothetical protein
MVGTSMLRRNLLALNVWDQISRNVKLVQGLGTPWCGHGVLWLEILGLRHFGAVFTKI